MNMRPALCLGVILSGLASGTLSAADQSPSLTGTWTGSLKWSDREFPQTFQFKQQGETLVGSMTTPSGGEAKIEEGRVKPDGLVHVRVAFKQGPLQFKKIYEG